MVNIISDTGLKSDITPVILNSTFLSKSPFSYPKIFSSDLISADVDIEDVIPEQFKNWFTVLSVYVTVLIPDIKFPTVLNPTVESTVTTLAPTPIFPITFVLPGIVNVPCIKSTSLKPTNKLTL